MKLQVKNFHMVDEAELLIDGLTVIAGDNDTGKSTIGKLLFSTIKSFDRFGKENNKIEHIFMEMISYLFNQHDLSNSELRLNNGQGSCYLKGNKDGIKISGNFEHLPIKNVIYIDNPIVWLLVEIFSKKEMANHLEDVYLLFDVYQKLISMNPVKSEMNFKEQILNKISSIIGGRIEYVNQQFSFIRNTDGKKFSLSGVASGIQNFAILDVLTRNEHIQPNSVLIIDEPEVHLHPQWEYEYAKLITDYVRMGVKVVLTTHSLYMVKALKEFSKDIPEKVNYYLTKKDANQKVSYENVTLETYKIFKKFSDPLQSLVWRKV